MAMFVKNVEIRFGNKDSFPNIDKRMNQIEEKFSKASINYPFRTVLKSYAEEDGEQMHSKIKFDFNGRDGIPMTEAIKIFEEWQGITKVDYSVYLRNMTISII